ncbi:MAG: hypothetical protein NVS4B12_02390 [Ktedonobacteraceae bacterium]
MDDCMNCIETVARLHLYIDRELSDEEVIIVQQHLENCQQCDCRFHFDLSIKRLIHERCASEQAPDHLREQVLHLLHSSRTGIIVVDAEFEAEMRMELEER